MGFCKKQSDVKKITKQHNICQEEKKEINKKLDSLKVENDKLLIEKKGLTEIDGVKTTSCEKQIILQEKEIILLKQLIKDRDNLIKKKITNKQD
jgi:hypothetical protein